MFKGQLLDFQQEDVDKLHTKRARLVGNDPGTGKTYVGIALDQLNRNGVGNSKVDLAELFPQGKLKTLVVCPKSVISSWDEHLMELTEDPIYVVDTKNRHIVMKQIADPKLGGYFVVTWDFIRLEVDALSKVYFLHVIADEVHKAKNRKSQQTRALKRLLTVYKTGLSGTPADNVPADLWSVVNWLWPNYYTSFWAFVEAYVSVEVTDEGYRKLGPPNMETVHILHKEMDSWFTRRRKQDVLQDLPDKYYTRLWVDLHPKQRKGYDQMKKTMAAWVEQHKDGLDREDPIIMNAAVTQLIRLQQFAAGYVIPKINNGEPIYFDEYIYKRKHKGHKRGECPYKHILLGDPELTFAITERVPCRDVQQFEVTDPSAKLDTVMEYLSDNDEQIVIWSQFKSVVNLFATRLEKADIPYGLLTGDVGQVERDKAMSDFQAGKTRVFTGTIAAGGTGIQLQNSSTSMFLDRVWSPSINTQAEDRQHRIGQVNAVQVIDIMARNTVDLGKAQKIAMKHKWLSLMLGDTVDADYLAEQMAEEIVLDDIELGEEQE